MQPFDVDMCQNHDPLILSLVHVYILNLVLVHVTIELSKTELGMFPLLLLGGIIENQNSDFVMQ